MQVKDKEILLTIFTPAYNRAYSLVRCYKSLVEQSCKEFIWLIIDDGSTDNTKELVREWQQCDNGFEIHYVYKENGGMHTAHNRAYELIDTELNVCIDSDDYMGENAAEKIITFWKNYGSDKYAGIIGLDADFEGNIIGRPLPEQRKSITLSGYYAEGGKGDKKLVYRTNLMKKYPPYPAFSGEKYVSLGYKYLLCDQEYELLILNEVLCNVEYQLDGSSTNMYRQYLRNPQGFAFIRKIDMQYDKSLKRKFMTCIHYVSSSIIARNKKFLQESPEKFLTACAIPFGIVLTAYIKKKSKGFMKIEGMKKK